MNSRILPFKKRENPLVTNQKPVVAATGSARDKYTATMDKNLRKKVKIAAVEKGVDFSQYIEEALTEKLEREGF